MKARILKYLDKRHTIIEGVIHSKDESPSGHVHTLFGDDYRFMFVVWAEEHIGENYSVIYPNGSRAWFKGKEVHREDGPAIVLNDGYTLHFLDGEMVSESKLKDYAR